MKKILYVAYFNTLTIQSIIHRFSKNKDSFAVLITNKEFIRKDAIEKVFDKVIYEANIVSEDVHFYNDEQKIENAIIETYDNMFRINEINIQEFDEIYMGCDMRNDFGIYCSLKNIEYIMCECAFGQFNNNRIKIYKWHQENINPHGSREYFIVSERHLSLCGTSPLVVKKLVESQSLGISQDYCNYELIDYNEELKNLSDTCKDLIVDCFDNDQNIRDYCKIAISCDFLFTQRQWKFPITETETGIMYQYLVDYVLGVWGKQLAIKPHPSDKYEHALFFEHALIFSNNFPSDIFPAILGFNINSALTISSSSVQKLISWNDNIIEVGETFFKIWRFINKLYFGYLIKKFLFDDKTQFYINEIPDGDLVFNFLQKYILKSKDRLSEWISLNNTFNGVCIVGDVKYGEYLEYESYYNTLLNLPDNSAIIFLDIDRKYNIIDFKHKELINNLITIEINKEPIKNIVYDKNEKEYIFVYTKSKEMVAKLRKFKMNKLLNNVGFNIGAVVMQNNDYYLLNNLLKDKEKSN